MGKGWGWGGVGWGYSEVVGWGGVTKRTSPSGFGARRISRINEMFNQD